jgi:ankyrin repeat protein
VPFTCGRCRVASLEDRPDPPGFVQEAFLQAAATLGLRAVVLAALHPMHMPRESAERWATAAFHSACLFGHHALALDLSRLFSGGAAPALVRGVVRYRAARGMALEEIADWPSADLTAVDSFGATALHLAAFGGHVELVQFLLRRAPRTVYNQTSYGATALHEAAMCGSSVVVRVLLEAGGQPWARNRLGDTPLMLAVGQNHYEAARVLLTHPPESFDDVLLVACAAGSAECALLLLGAGADVHAMSGPLDHTALHAACASGQCSPTMVSLLLAHGANPLALDKRGCTALMSAVKAGRVKEVELMMEAIAASPDFATAGAAALAECAFQSGTPSHVHEELAELLVTRFRVPLNETALRGATPLLLACRAGSLRLVRVLLSAGASLVLPDSRGNNVVHVACMLGNERIVSTLIEEGGSSARKLIDALNDDGYTPLQIACRHNYVKVRGSCLVAATSLTKGTPLPRLFACWSATSRCRRLLT